MYQQYNEFSMRILNDLQTEGKTKSLISTTKTSIRKFREYMQTKELQYSPEIAAEWLEKEIRPNFSHSVYKKVRFIHYRIAILFDPEQNLKELFYTNLKSNYDRLPLWAQVVVSGFLMYYRSKQKCIALFKAGASTFLLHQIHDGMDSISNLSYECCAYYYRKYGPVTGVGPFLAYLENKRMISPYVHASYNFKFSKRILEVPLDSPLRIYITGYSLQEYKAAQEKVFRILNLRGYSSTMKEAFISASNEFGVFLGLNGLCYSQEAATFYLENFRSNILSNIYAIRRSILSIGYILDHGEKDSIPLVFSTKQPRAYPDWAKYEVAAYKAIRERTGKCRSTLDMDRSSLTRFLFFLDSNGCQKFDDITAERIKNFNLQDQHSSNEGKNAYNVRIRGFLRFLESRGLVSKGITKALPSVNGLKVRPAVILSSDDQNSINCYCDKTEQAGKYLESAVLKIVSQTGLRGIDISSLRSDSIDWCKQEFSLIQQKTKRHIRLPFSNGVGNIILKYIEEERPRQKSPYLFISPRAPHGRLSKTQINRIVSKALDRRSGIHILRKTFASNLLQAGAEFDYISDVLGHESPKAVDSYLSTDTARMRLCAIPLGNALQYKGGLL